MFRACRNARRTVNAERRASYFCVGLIAASIGFGSSAQALDPSALPTGGTVAAGSASITQSGQRLSVQQQSDRAIVNWNTFNIGSQAAVQFQQPGPASVALNRVSAGGGASEIYGSLTANGQVFLVNPAGTLFGRGAQVNVGGLVASSLDLGNDNFLNGLYRFTSSGSPGAVVNQGTLSASDGGYVVLLAPTIRNEGAISAPRGTVALGAGNAVTLDIGGAGVLSLRIDQASLEALIENSGVVRADGGRVHFTAHADGQIASGVINNRGEIYATRITEGDGFVRLEAGEVSNSGSISADGSIGGSVTLLGEKSAINSGTVSAQGHDGKGGEIRVLGDKVGLFGSGSLDASGQTGGGTILVGGNFQGKGPEQNAAVTVVGPEASLRADALGQGDGGRIIVWSDNYTNFAGSLQARGGRASGSGGFAEVSGKQALDFSPRSIDLKAPVGAVGTLLLDPLNIVVATGGTAPIASVNTFATQAGTTQTIDPATLNAAGATVSLQATNDISVNSAINLTTAGAGLDARAGNNINLNAPVTTTNGPIAFSARNFGGTQTAGGTVNLNSSVSSNGGAITITNSGGTSPIALTGTVSAGAGDVTFLDNVNLTNVGTSIAVVSGANVTFAGAVQGTTAGGQSLTVNGSGITTFANTVGTTLVPLASLSTDAPGSTTFNGNVFAGGGSGVSTTTPTITISDPATVNGVLTLASTGGGKVSVSDISAAAPSSLTISTSGAIVFTGSSAVGSLSNPLIFSQTPSAVQTQNPISLVFSSPAQPAGLIFAPGSSVQAFLGGSGSGVTLAANAAQLLASATVTSGTVAESAQAVNQNAPKSSRPSPDYASLEASGLLSPGLSTATGTEMGTLRLTATSGLSQAALREIDQQIGRARTQLFSSALSQLAKDPALADVPSCEAGQDGECVKSRRPQAAGPVVSVAGDAGIKRKVALLFGNQSYLAPIPSLETPINDIEEIGRVLKEKLGYETRIIRNASRNSIVGELNHLIAELDADDSVLVYYAGHGHQAEKGSGYWIPSDASNIDASTWISNAAISKFLANMASRQVMLVSDSCYSGTLAQEQQVRMTEATVFDRKEILRKRSVLVMSSGGNEPVADGGRGRHSIFAYHLLNRLGQIQADLVGSDIHAHVREAVIKDYPQDPQYGAVITAGHVQGGEYLIEKK